MSAHQQWRIPAHATNTRGRDDALYLQAARIYRTNQPPCALHTGPWCTGTGHEVDHDPPLATFTNPAQWHGHYQPACAPCQRRQGRTTAANNARQANATAHGTTTWTW